jgi:hypothetical protein
LKGGHRNNIDMAEFEVDALLLETSTGSHQFGAAVQNDALTAPNVMKSQGSEGDLNVTSQLKHVGELCVCFHAGSMSKSFFFPRASSVSLPY